MRFPVIVELDTLAEAVALARRLDAEGFAHISVDTGEGYGVRGCPAEGCGSPIYYPDEVDCGEHVAGVKV